MADMIVLTLQYDKINNTFHASRSDIKDYPLPENDNTYIIANTQWGDFLTKYVRSTLGSIRTNKDLTQAYYVDVFDPEKDYAEMYPEMKTALVKQTQEEIDQLMEFAKALKEAGL